MSDDQRPEILPLNAGPSIAAIAALDAALIKARSAFKPLVRTAQNPHFRNNYCPLEGVLEAVTPALTANGLSLSSNFALHGERLLFVTTLSHTGGGYRQSLFPVTDPSPQKAGATATYGTRYNVTALLGVASEDDDDGNIASGAAAKKAGKPSAVPAAPASQGNGNASWDLI